MGTDVMERAELKDRSPPRMTVEEFLAWDDGTDTRYELIGGEIVAMTPPFAIHTRVVANLAGALVARLKSPCGVNVEAGIRLSDKEGTYYQADVAVSCAPMRPEGRHVPDPVVIVEVLSPGTATFDRGTKVPDYRTLSSVEEIIVVSATKEKVELWRRTGDDWTVSDVEGRGAVLRLASVGVEVPLAAIYQGVAFEPAERAAER